MKKLFILFIIISHIANLKAQDDSVFFKINSLKYTDNRKELKDYISNTYKKYPENDFFKREYIINQADSNTQNLINAALSWLNNEANYYLAKFYVRKKNKDSAFYYLKNYLEDYHQISQYAILADSDFNSLAQDQRWQEIKQESSDFDYQKVIYNANFFIKIDKIEQAISLLDNFLQKRDNPYVLVARANIFYKLKNFQAAVNDYTRAYKIKKNTDWLKKIGICYYKLEKYRKVEENLSNYVKQNKYDIESIQYLAFSQIKLKKYQKAKSNLLIIQNYYTEFQLFLNLAIIYETENKLLTALKYYSKALNIKPYDRKTRLKRANIYFKTENYLFADKDYTQYLDQNPQNIEIFYKRGLCRIYTKKYKKACADLKRAYIKGYAPAYPYWKQYCKENKNKK